MANALKIRPPFAWLGKHTAIIGLLGAVGLAAFFRFFQLPSLPPGLHSSSAGVGLQALNLLNHGTLPGLDAANNFAPFWVLLQAITIKLLGNSELALRLWPALIGTLAVLATWLWARSWFGLRIAWLASLLLAVTPWAVTLSRNGVEAAIFPLLTTLTLWVATVAWRRPSLWHSLALAGVLTLDLLSGPIGWLTALTVLGVGVVVLAKQKSLFSIDRPRLTAVGGLALGLAVFGYLAAASMSNLKALPQVAGLVPNLSTLGSNLVKTLLMFNVTGDENYRHNLSGEPMLNAFVGLMLVAGILTGISRLHERRYRLLFLVTIVLFLPAVVTTVGVPNAARASAILPLILVFSAVGISYMLELWYRTFPINSAARTLGQSAIIVLLGLSVFQGYTQYFRAWAGSSQVHTAYNEGAVKIAKFLQTDKFSGQRFVVGSSEELPVVAYLTHNKTSYTAMAAKDIAGLPITPGPRQFLISAVSKPEAVKNLRLKFPGGVLRPLYSDLNQSEISYVYEVKK